MSALNGMEGCGWGGAWGPSGFGGSRCGAGIWDLERRIEETQRDQNGSTADPSNSQVWTSYPDQHNEFHPFYLWESGPVQHLV